MVIDAHVRSLLFVVYATDIIHIFYPSNGATKSKNRRPSKTACRVQRRTRQKKKRREKPLARQELCRDADGTNAKHVDMTWFSVSPSKDAQHKRVRSTLFRLPYLFNNVVGPKRSLANKANKRWKRWEKKESIKNKRIKTWRRKTFRFAADYLNEISSGLIQYTHCFVAVVVPQCLCDLFGRCRPKLCDKNASF